MGKWTYESVKEIARKFNSLGEWKTKHRASYEWAYKYNLQRKIAEELGWEIRTYLRWTYESVKEKAKAFDSLGVWSIKHPPSYQWAHKYNLQRKIAKELGWEVIGGWTYESVKEKAKAFDSLGVWGVKHPTSYQWAHRYNLHRKIAKELGWKIKRHYE